jgi:hypothetical protein
VGGGREDRMLCKIFSLSLPSLLESLSGLIMAHVYMEVRCMRSLTSTSAHLPPRQLQEGQKSRKPTARCTTITSKSARRVMPEWRPRTPALA